MKTLKKREKFLKRIALFASVLLFLPCTGYAASPSNNSLKGTYAFQFSQTQAVTWGRKISIVCFKKSYTVQVYGQSVGTEIVVGTMTFTGSGTVTVSVTKYGVFNQDASNAGGSAVCGANDTEPIETIAGNPVFDNGITGSDSGTYSVASNGTGSLTLPATGGNNETVQDFVLGDYNSEGVAQAALFMQAGKNNGNGGTGTALLK